MTPSRRKIRIPQENRRHTERCKACKIAFKALLQENYGVVTTGPKFPISTQLASYVAKPWYSNLARIHNALASFRGHSQFAIAPRLSQSDFLLDDIQQLVEFDESQHFTAARAVALAEYPRSLEVGFDRKVWISKCESIGAKDNSPVFRDEQRAWYDTLRDFLPLIVNKMRPTIRVYAGACRWCDFDSRNAADCKRFFGLITARS